MTNDKKLLTLAYISKYGVNLKNILSHDSEVTIMAWEIDIINFRFCKGLDNKFKSVNQSLSIFL